MTNNSTTEYGAVHSAANQLTAAIQAIVLERLARDPQRLERALAEAEAEAWAEVSAAIKDVMKAAIVEKLSASGVTLPPLTASILAEQRASSANAMPTPTFDPPDTAPTDIADTDTADTDTADTDTADTDTADTDTADTDTADTDTISTGAIGDADIDVVPVLETMAVAPLDEGVGIYVYGVAVRGAVILPEIAGAADDSFVRLHEYGGLAAVVSDVPLREFGQSAIELQLGDLVWLEKSVRRHQSVLDEVLSLTALAPMKFATIYLDSTRLDAWLEEQQTHLLALLAWLRHRQEWGLKLLVDRAVLAERVAAYSEPVRELRAQIEGKSQGAVYFLVRRIQEVTAEEVERVSFAVADAVHERLAAQSVAACLNPLPAEDVEPNVQMLLNSAYLIADDQVEAVQEIVGAFVAEHGDNGFRFQLSGPWPAYNFVAMAPDVEENSDGR